MKILVENSGYYLKNMGDLAMLEVGINRLKKMFPDASIRVFTLDPEELEKRLPGTIPISPRGRDTWSWPLVHSLYNSPNAHLSRQWQRVEKYLIGQQPELRKHALKLKLRKHMTEFRATQEFLNEIEETDLVIATGGGFITDAFMGITSPKLDTLTYAARLGKKTALLGQGIGPLKKSENYERAKKAFDSVDLIFLREGEAGIPLLSRMGISPNKIVVTGDDAIELAFSMRQSHIGSSLGINLRIASYSSVNRDYIEVLRSVVYHFSSKEEVNLLPVPIERSVSNEFDYSDSNSIKMLLNKNDSCDGGASLDTPLKVIKQVGKCRLVITGSYHAGVFALSQGIPVIGLAKSQYYVDKFSGLSKQFPGGCEIVLLDDENLEEDMELKLKKLWEAAEVIRPQLLDSAQQQIELGHLAYQRICSL
jgi:polysaccharide pyruvyl transferase WcaK-like protein